eukprot:Skav209723  [mRNA]  locus=scaffold528:403604:411285:+ [translate_table: standard]
MLTLRHRLLAPRATIASSNCLGKVRKLLLQSLTATRVHDQCSRQMQEISIPMDGPFHFCHLFSLIALGLELLTVFEIHPPFLHQGLSHC